MTTRCNGVNKSTREKCPWSETCSRYVAPQDKIAYPGDCGRVGDTLYFTMPGGFNAAGEFLCADYSS